MKRLSIVIFILIIAAFFSKAIAQNTTYNAVVKHQKNNTPLQGATIVVMGTNTGTTTGLDGSFGISVTENQKIQISLIGYKTKEFVVDFSQKNLFLSPETTFLQEVIVSASREEQKRSEIPAAVSVVSQKQIQALHPMGVEQIVNQAPGVYMSTSKASGNEQHFMAVRSPISTKSLFLYIEDGLPIRPTAVFNHNALLELNTDAMERVEILRGPASSIYGSEAIGGSFNFITKKPTKDLSGSVTYQANDLGYSQYATEVSNYVTDKVGFYLSANYAQRKDGLVGHSDYSKFAFTFKTLAHLGKNTDLTSVFDIIDYYSDMSGSVNEANYLAEKYQSNQTFTSRKAKAFRFRTTLDTRWNALNKTSFHVMFRNNSMNQVPSYRIRQKRIKGVLTGVGSGETNKNHFASYLGLLQHKVTFNFADASFIAGASLDFSPQRYSANPIAVSVDTATATNTSYTVDPQEYLMRYNADIYNYAAYGQFEIAPFTNAKVTAALRYDAFVYDYTNLLATGVPDVKTNYDKLTPKVGFNYAFNAHCGVYTNFSTGFSPPSAGSLYRNSNAVKLGGVFDLKPSSFKNIEVGGFTRINDQLKLDLALYLLEGKDRLVTLKDDDGNYISANAGKTRSMGVEYGFNYTPFKWLSLSHTGSYASHKYVHFIDKDKDYSDTQMQTAPKLLGNTTLRFTPQAIKDFALDIEYETMGEYNTSFENQAVIGQSPTSEPIYGTTTYKGHHIFNAKVSYAIKGFSFWLRALNVLDDRYAVRASYNRYSNQNTYSIGNPRAFHAGVRYTF